MPATITHAPQVQDIGQWLIGKFHPHLLDATILYLLTDQTRRSKGKVVLGTAKKASPMEQFLGASHTGGEPADFILMFGAEEWFGLSEDQRIALVDHQLCHLAVEHDEDDNPSWTIRGHDFEEFVEIIERHGLWAESLQSVAAAMEQLRLPLGIEATV